LNQQIAHVREHLDAAKSASFESAWAEGKTATPEQAIDRALAEIAPGS
jgi:hypothetical protein